MREILFHGKRKDNGEWVEGFLYCFYNFTRTVVQILTDRTNGIPDAVEVDPETVGQYINMDDINGKKIFEGNIVKCRHEFHAWDWKLYGRDKEEAFRTKKIRRAYKKEVFKDDYGCSCYYLRNYVIAMRDDTLGQNLAVIAWLPKSANPAPLVPTFKDVFLKRFPGAVVLPKSGVPVVCAKQVFPQLGDDESPCDMCCAECWNNPYFEEEGGAE